jgi:hypothetical protein
MRMKIILMVSYLIQVKVVMMNLHAKYGYFSHKEYL